MALSAAELDTLGGLVSAAGSVEAAQAAVRAAFPQLRTRLLDAVDLRDERPALMAGSRPVYLAEIDGLCWRMTCDPQRASAVLLALP